MANIPASICYRTTQYMRQGMSINDALEHAVADENDFIRWLLSPEQKTIFKHIADAMAPDVYRALRAAQTKSVS